MARNAGKMRGDLRAMEIQNNDPRTNPVQLASGMSGSGATPSAGLSQFRGGAMPPDYLSAAPARVVGGRHRRKHRIPEEESESNEMEGGGLISGMYQLLKDPSMKSLYIKGKGGAHHRTKNAASRLSEAEMLGANMGRHIHSLHGKGFWGDFGRGFMSVLKPIAGIAKMVLPMIPHPAAKAAGVGLNVLGPAIGLGHTHAMRGATGESMAGGAMYPSGPYEGQGRERDDEAMVGGRPMGGVGRRMRGKGRTRQQILDQPMTMDMVRGPNGQMMNRHQEALYKEFGELPKTKKGGRVSRADQARISEAQRMDSGVQRGANEAEMARALSIANGAPPTGGKKRRAPAGPSDGRRARAEVVRKVMREKGLKMIEASKYVKEHGLYKGRGSCDE